ncbi:MAG: methyltransferase domain-containing protein [Deltaproteobacteria bacterium]|nr:methyltransferase domain-containing protein [Deltaproteobacteria bacterium]
MADTPDTPDSPARPPSRRPLSPYHDAPKLPTEPITIGDIVKGDGPVMLEIGPGRGRFALEFCAARPDWRVLAIEIRRKSSHILDARMRARGWSERARCFADDAREVLPRIGPDGSVDAAAIHFPDPWWKARHNKRLVVTDALVPELARLVRPGGLVLVQTDVPHRAEAYYPRFAEHPAFESLGNPYVDDSPFAPARSNREAIAIVDGLPVYRMVFRRK